MAEFEVIEGGGGRPIDVDRGSRAARLADVIREELGDLPRGDQFRVAVEKYVVHLDRLAGQAHLRLLVENMGEAS